MLTGEYSGPPASDGAQTSPSAATAVGIVLIGRNEGLRLPTSLKAALLSGVPVVYVDSGSADGSPEVARALGAAVIELDEKQPFTAARGRNAGFAWLRCQHPSIAFVQFVDGDCELDPDWLRTAETALQSRPELAVVSGRLRERHPQQSVYNRLCDIEWDAPVGEAQACGGNAMYRATAFEQMNGFRSDLIAGEEPELCVRLRQTGWRIWRLASEMATHDAAMLYFGQWWRRTVRTGYGYAEGAHMHGTGPSRHWVRESRRALAWGVALPFAVLALLPVFGAATLALLLAYPLQVARLALKGEQESPWINWQRAFFLVLGRFPEGVGQVKFLLHRSRRVRPSLIEYKQ